MDDIVKVLDKYVKKLVKIEKTVIIRQIIKTMIACCKLTDLTEMLKSYSKFKTKLLRAHSSLGLFSKDTFSDLCAIGRGGYGRVYKGKHCINGRNYAIKEMSKARILKNRAI